jgi:hypothetical protein
MCGIFRGNLCVDHSEEGIVEIIQNLIDFALEGNLTEELLCQDVGIVVGYALQEITENRLRFTRCILPA